MIDHVSQRFLKYKVFASHQTQLILIETILILAMLNMVISFQFNALQAQDKVTPETQLAVQIVHVDASDFPILRYYVSVNYADGEPVVGLKKANFFISSKDSRKFINPKSARPITEVSNEETPQLFLALVINNAENLSGIRDELRKAIVGFAGAAKSRGFKVALLIFEGEADVYKSKIKTLTEFTSDKFAVDEGLTEMTLYDNSIIYDTLYKAIKYARQEAGYRRAAVVLFTLSKDHRSIYTLSQCVDFAKEEHVPIFSIGLKGNFLTAIFVNYNKKKLMSLADKTGGRFLPCKRIEYLPQVLKTVLDTTTGRYLENQYLLLYEDEDLYSEKRERAYSIRVTQTVPKGKLEGSSDCEIKLSKANLEKVLKAYLAKMEKEGEKSIKAKEFAKAVKLLDEIAARTPVDPKDVSFFTDAYLGYGDNLLADGKIEEALAAYNKVGGDEAKKKISLAYIKQGDALSNAGRISEAISAYKKSNEPSAREALRNAYTNYGKSLITKKPPLFNEAIENFKNALEIDPQFTDAIYGLADVSSQLAKDLVVQNRLDRAARVLADVDKAVPPNAVEVKRNVAKRIATVRLELGRAAYSSCKFPIAVSSFSWVCDNYQKHPEAGLIAGETIKGIQIEYAGALIANLDFGKAIALIKQRITDDINNETYWTLLSLAVKAKYYHDVVRCIQIFVDQEKNPQSIVGEIPSLQEKDIVYYGVVGKDGEFRFWKTPAGTRKVVRAAPEVVKQAVKSQVSKETALLSTVTPKMNEDIYIHFIVPLSSAGANTPIHSYFRLGISARLKEEDYVRKQLIESLTLDELLPYLDSKIAVKVYTVCAKVLSELMGNQLSRLADIRYVAQPYISYLKNSERVKYIVVAGADGLTTSIPKTLERTILNDKKANEMKVTFKQTIRYKDYYVSDITLPVYSQTKQWKGVVRLGIAKAKAQQ